MTARRTGTRYAPIAASGHDPIAGIEDRLQTVLRSSPAARPHAAAELVDYLVGSELLAPIDDADTFARSFAAAWFLTAADTAETVLFFQAEQAQGRFTR